jgi:hypothetical protein
MQGTFGINTAQVAHVEAEIRAAASGNLAWWLVQVVRMDFFVLCATCGGWPQLVYPGHIPLPGWQVRAAFACSQPTLSGMTSSMAQHGKGHMLCWQYVATQIRAGSPCCGANSASGCRCSRNALLDAALLEFQQHRLPPGELYMHVASHAMAGLHGHFYFGSWRVWLVG